MFNCIYNSDKDLKLLNVYIYIYQIIQKRNYRKPESNCSLDDKDMRVINNLGNRTRIRQGCIYYPLYCLISTLNIFCTESRRRSNHLGQRLFCRFYGRTTNAELTHVLPWPVKIMELIIPNLWLSEKTTYQPDTITNYKYIGIYVNRRDRGGLRFAINENISWQFEPDGRNWKLLT